MSSISVFAGLTIFFADTRKTAKIGLILMIR